MAFLKHRSYSPILIKQSYTKLECPALASVNSRPTIYNKIRNLTQLESGNMSLTLDSKTRPVVLALLVLSNKKSLEIAHVPRRIRNKKLKLINWVVN